MTFDCWHPTCVFCGTCEFYCPTKAIHQTNDWHLAHFQSEKFGMTEHGLIPNQVCADCGGKGLNTVPNTAKVKPALSAEELVQLRARCPKCRNKFLKNRGKKP